VLGCTTAGEFTETGTGTGGVAAVAVPKPLVRRSASALADLSSGVSKGVRAAVKEIETQLGESLREVDTDRYIGLMLVDGVHGSEEEINEALGDAAPLLSFVGGSAGDDLAFAETRVFLGGQSSHHGAALAVLQLSVPYAVVKTCSFTPADTEFVASKVDRERRIVWEFDGRPATERYAEAVGVAVDQLGSEVFMSRPLGLMIDGKPWIRSPQAVEEGGGIRFYCQILQGMRITLMTSTPLVTDTAVAMRAAAAEVGGTPSGAILFNCVLRRLEMDANGWADDFVGALGGVPTAGFHCYGESYLGHVNQTLTGVVFG
jgi:hypothetical protein